MIAYPYMGGAGSGGGGGGRVVHLNVGGQTYRVVTTASEDEMHRLRTMVEEKLALVAPPGRMVNPQALLLAALALAHDLEEACEQNAELRGRARAAMSRMLERVDAALGTPAPNAEAETAPAPAQVPEPAPANANANKESR